MDDPGANPDWQAIVLERIATHAPLDATLDFLVQLVEAQIPGSVGSLLLLDAATRTLHAGSVRGLPAAYNAAIEGIAIGPTVGSCGTAAYLAQTVIVDDIERDPLWADYRGLAHEHGMRACWSTPILSRREPGVTVLGTFALYFRTPSTPDRWAAEVLARAGSIACIAIDAERSTAALRETETRFRTFVDHATDGFLVFGPNSNRVADANLHACASLGYTRQELIGTTPVLFDPLYEARFRDAIHRMALGDVVAFESRNLRKDGSSFPVEVRIKRFDERGQQFRLAVVRDITTRLELEGQLREAHKLEAIGRLAGGVAHDFNNLLTVINAHAELVLDTLAADDPNRPGLEILRDSGLRGAALTSQLLAFGRRTLVTPKPLDLAMLIARLAEVYTRIVGEQIELRTEIHSRDTVLADDAMIEQVLMNLVANARDAMPHGGTLTISTRTVVLASVRHFALTVADTGEGMTDEVKQRMFEPFFTTKPVGKGSGLGLASVYGIVAQAGGQIRVDSQPGRGTAVELLFPTIDAPPVTASPAHTAARQGTEVILVAEDEEPLRRVVQRGLVRHGYTVLAARDLTEALALEQAHAGPIDLLLTDLVMPGGGGRDLAAALRLRRPEVKVVFMSGYTDDAIVRAGVTDGSDPFLGKPFTIRALVDKLRAVLDA